jgi:hypothetical protein
MPKLTIDTPDFFSIIGKRGGKARKKSGADYSAIAAMSHPRDEYRGGRPKGSKNKPAKKAAKKKGKA